MKFEDLSKENQALLNTDFGADIEKEAAEQVKVAESMIALGAEYATELADSMDKQAAEEKDYEEKMKKVKEDKESEKTASECALFIEKGFVEELQKIASERHSNPNYYLASYVSEKLAAEGQSVDEIKVAMEKMEDEGKEKFKKMIEAKKEEKEDAKKEASAEEQALLDTDFGAEIEKEAAEQVKVAQEMLALGVSYAREVADNIDASVKTASETPAEEESTKVATVELTEEQEKYASDLSRFIEKGFTEKLASLGQERHEDPAFYIAPFVMEKEAAKSEGKSKAEGHHVRRAILGNPLSAAIEAKKGKKMDAFGEAAGHQIKETVKGVGKGVAGGGAGGAIAGAIHGAVKGKGGAKKRLARAGADALKGLGLGAAGGGYVGSIAGGLKGQHGSEASKIHGKYSKNK